MWKKSLLIFAILYFFLGDSKSQSYSYHSFPDSNITWIGFSYCHVHWDSWQYPWTYRASGDSIVDGILYRKIYGNFDITTLVREDSSRKVYFRNYPGLSTSTSEELLYDFSLSLGDTITIMGSKRTVFSVDTPLYNGIARRTLHLTDSIRYLSGSSHGYYLESWIEGIGSWQGPMGFAMFPAIWCQNGNLCTVVQDSIILLQRVDELAGLCFNYNSLEGFTDLKDVIIFPNPCCYSFNIQLPSAPLHAIYFQLYNSLGNLVKHEEVNSRTAIMFRHGLSDGIYFWQLRSDNKILDRGKLVME